MNFGLIELWEHYRTVEEEVDKRADKPLYEVLIHDVQGRPGFEATAVFEGYPNYTDMLNLFRKHDIPARDFIDTNSCMKDKLVYGEAHKTYLCRGVPIAHFTTERIRGGATKLEELLR